MCGVEKCRVSDIIEAIKALKKDKKDDVDDDLKNKLKYCMLKLEEVIKARPKDETPDSPCPCGQCERLKSIPLLTI